MRLVYVVVVSVTSQLSCLLCYSRECSVGEYSREYCSVEPNTLGNGHRQWEVLVVLLKQRRCLATSLLLIYLLSVAFGCALLMSGVSVIGQSRLIVTFADMNNVQSFLGGQQRPYTKLVLCYMRVSMHSAWIWLCSPNVITEICRTLQPRPKGKPASPQLVFNVTSQLSCLLCYSYRRKPQPLLCLARRGCSQREYMAMTDQNVLLWGMLWGNTQVNTTLRNTILQRTPVGSGTAEARTAWLRHYLLHILVEMFSMDLIDVSLHGSDKKWRQKFKHFSQKIITKFTDFLRSKRYTPRSVYNNITGITATTLLAQ